MAVVKHLPQLQNGLIRLQLQHILRFCVRQNGADVEDVVGNLGVAVADDELVDGELAVALLWGLAQRRDRNGVAGQNRRYVVGKENALQEEDRVTFLQRQ